MTNQKTRISRGLAVIIDSVVGGSHQKLNSLFLSAGAPEPIPDGSHAHKWRDWIITAGRDPNVDNFEFIGGLIEEFMDVPPLPSSGRSGPFGIDLSAIQDEQQRSYYDKRKRLEDALAAEGLQYFRSGRIIPMGTKPDSIKHDDYRSTSSMGPSSIDEVLMQVVKGLRRAMSPLTHRRKGLPTLAFDSEYDVQDLLHVLLRPWVKDIRSEEYTPSYAGKSTRMDFLLPDHTTVVELKFVRDVAHGKNIGQELQIDIGHYRQHPKCQRLLCVVFDPNNFLVNSGGLASDLEGQHRQDNQTVDVKVVLL
jgi:REase_DpnII-MboI